MRNLGLKLVATPDEWRWCKAAWTEHHYLHSAIDPRCRPIAYIVEVDGQRRGALGFGRPESTRCNGWYGGVDDVAQGRARLTRWELINLARVWLDPRIQPSGAEAIHNAGSQAISLALGRVALDYLCVHPPCFLDEPYALKQCISYCDTATHKGVIYRAANFKLMRTNDRGLQTWMRPLRGLMPHERLQIQLASNADMRARRFRAQRNQLSFSLSI